MQANNIIPFTPKTFIAQANAQIDAMDAMEIIEDNATEATSDLLQLLDYFGYQVTNEHDMGMLYHTIRASMMRLADIPHPMHEVAEIMIKIVDE